MTDLGCIISNEKSFSNIGSYRHGCRAALAGGMGDENVILKFPRLAPIPGDVIFANRGVDVQATGLLA